MEKSKLFLLFVVAFLGGIFLGEVVLSEEFLKGFVVFVVGIVFLFKSGWFREGRKIFKVFLIVLIALLFGMFRFLISFDGGEGHVRNLEGFVEIRGCVVDEVDVRADKVKYTIEAEAVKVGDEWNSVHGKVLVNGDRYPVYEYGDILVVRGKIEEPGVIENFNYDKYLARYDIYSVIYWADVSKVSDGCGCRFFEIIYYLKDVFESRLESVFAEPHASFMAGLLLGSRRGIPDHLMSDFNTTGLTHIIAISGYNVTLVVVVVSGLFGFLSRRWKVVLSIIFVILFVIFVGMSASVVRAGIMGIIGLIALWFGRQYFVGLALFGAAFLMCMWNPKILVYDVGFQLSFLATSGLIYVSPLIERYFKWLPAFLGLREAATMTMSALIMALPIIVLNFGRLSVVSPLANMLVLPLIPWAMMTGFFAVIVSFLWSGFGVIFGFVGYLILELIVIFVEFFASFEFSSVEVGWFLWWMVLLYYLVVWEIVLRNLN